MQSTFLQRIVLFFALFMLLGVGAAPALAQGRRDKPTTVAAPATQLPPQLGAQIWLEPGHTPAQIDQWFALLEQHQMPVTRLFVMWNFIEQPDGSYDWQLYDNAYASAQKHGVKIVATLMPNFGPPHRGFYYRTQDGSIPKTQEQLDESREFIKRTVERYKNHPAQDSWMMMNEPGQAHTPDPLAMSRFKDFLKQKYGTVQKLNSAWLTGFKSFEEITYTEGWSSGGWTWPVSYLDWNTFWRDHLAWYLGWVSAEIRKYDQKSGLHINPHALLDITSRYSLPDWRKFLTTLGCSIHPVWHFGILKQVEYTMGVGFVSDMIRGASEPQPFWVTELQGGQNIYTANEAVRPGAQQVARWVWTSVGSGAKRTIFWCLNARGKSTEAGEWSMLTYQGLPSERLTVSGNIAKTINQHSDFFTTAKPVEMPVTILLSQETMLVQERSAAAKDVRPGRGQYAHKYEALGIYKALTARGYTPRIKLFNDFTPQGGVIIVPHITAMTNAQIAKLEQAKTAGATIITTGFSGFFDEEEACRALTGKDLSPVTGYQISELVPLENPMTLQLGKYEVPVRDFKAMMIRAGSKTVPAANTPLTGLRHSEGKGRSLLLPALVGHGAWFGDATPLAQLLADELQQAGIGASPLSAPVAGVTVRQMQGAKGDRCLILANENTQSTTVNLSAGNATVWYGDAKVSGQTVTIAAGETAVLYFAK